MTNYEHVTVAVVGGGPAGASAALELARLGIATIVIERSDGNGNPVGECLAPSANPLLQRLGLDSTLQSTGALPSYGNQSAWGGDGRSVDHDFLRDPFGHGWHLDRPAFNRALLDAAAIAGVSIRRTCRVASVDRVADGWHVKTMSQEGASVLHASMLVDATGRRALVARHQGVRRRVFDSQVGTVAFLDAPPNFAPFQDATTVIESAPNGWWYAALLPNRRLAVSWFTDPDLLAASVAWRAAEWWKSLRRSDHVGPLVVSHGFSMPQRISVVAAGSSLLPQPAGERWIAIGDAAAAYDPLSSHGIGSALAGGRSAAKAVMATLSGDRTAFAAYRERLFADYAHYLWMRHAYYAEEQRWTGEPFWERRHSPMHARRPRNSRSERVS